MKKIILIFLSFFLFLFPVAAYAEDCSNLSQFWDKSCTTNNDCCTSKGYTCPQASGAQFCDNTGGDLSAYSQEDCQTGQICYYDPAYNDLSGGKPCGNLKGYIVVGDSHTDYSCGGGNGAFCCQDSSTLTPTAIPTPPNPCPNAPTPGICQSVDTAIGNIDVSGPGGFIKTAFAVLLSISGGVALLLIIFSGYRIMTAQGDPEKVKGAREMLASAIIGLLFIIFSATILQIIGFDILHIPGFGK